MEIMLYANRINKKLPRSIFGNQEFLPACHRSDILSELLESKTFTDRQVDYLEMLGIKIEYTPYKPR
tara:strand:+ start:74 stop:274 length:201 start_codon:yes stop_codon:yes gene_type:complete